MRQMKKIIISFLLIVTVTACDFLKFDETSGIYTQESIYKYFDNAKKALTYVYTYMPQDFGTIGGAMRDCACDDAEYADPGAGVQSFNNGTWSAIKTYDTAWNLYEGIRAANDFITNIEEADFSRFEYDKNYPNMMAQIRYFIYEAKVLRAFYFFELARRYGDIPMPLKTLSQDEANNITLTAFDDVIDFIAAECDECAGKAEDGAYNLPDTYMGQPNNETGRVTRGFAMAVKSKALLYAASKLHNPDNDLNKWKRSAEAALDLIDSGLYKLDPRDKCNNLTSPEVVMFRMNAESNSFELYNFPIRFTEGARSNPDIATFPTQNLVDAFQTLNGYRVTLTEEGWVSDDPKFNSRRPYQRDPRFSRAVLAHNQAFKGDRIQLQEGGIDNMEVSLGGTPTGYFLKKYIQETTSFNPNDPSSKMHHWVVYRYAETLLTYAESMVEAFGDPDYSDATYTRSARWAINQVRANVEMPNVTAGGKEEFIEALRNEWRVEFAFEDHRFWDIRRWKIGKETQKEVFGVKIVNNGSYDQYSLFKLEDRVWSERMYLYPFPQSEIFKNPTLENNQNKGW